MKLLTVFAASLAAGHAEWLDRRAFDDGSHGYLGPMVARRDLPQPVLNRRSGEDHVDDNSMVVFPRAEEWEYVKSSLSEGSGSLVSAPGSNPSWADKSSEKSFGVQSLNLSDKGKKGPGSSSGASQDKYHSAASNPSGGSPKNKGKGVGKGARLEDTAVSQHGQDGGASQAQTKPTDRPGATMVGGRRTTTSKRKAEYKRKSAMVEEGRQRTAKHKGKR